MRKPRGFVVRVALALIIGTGLATVSAGPADAATVAYPTQSIGSRGTDVRAIQYLLRHRGYSVPPTGYFGSMTRAAVQSFQRRVGLTPDGIVSASTWSRLVATVRSGNRNSNAVRAVQALLNEKMGNRLLVDGWFGSGTRSAVVAFQRGHGLSADGVVGPITWRYLAWHFKQPNFAASSLCPYPTGANGHRGHWGTSAVIAVVEGAARTVHAAGHGPVAVGDISLHGGGFMRGHRTHQMGLDVDIRPMRTANNQCSWGVTWYRWSNGRKVCCNPAYDRSATRALIRALRASSGGHLDVIAFNDPQLIREGLTIHVAGHDDHLHASFCEVRHFDRRYVC